ncbi:hypothetical protein RFI_33265, partial [Reticulomyxa filosa]
TKQNKTKQNKTKQNQKQRSKDNDNPGPRVVRSLSPLHKPINNENNVNSPNAPVLLKENNETTPSICTELSQQLREFDKDNDGCLSFREFKSFLQSLHIPNSPYVTISMIEHFFSDFITNQFKLIPFYYKNKRIEI